MKPAAFLVLGLTVAAVEHRTGGVAVTASGEPDTVTVRLDAPVGQVGHYREVATVLRMGDRSGPGLYMIIYSTRRVVAASGDTTETFIRVDSSALTSGGTQPVTRYTDVSISARRLSDGRDVVTRLSPAVYATPGLYMTMIAVSGSRPALVVPRRPLRVGEQWSDTVVTHLVVSRSQQQADTVELTFRLKALRADRDGRRAVITARGVALESDAAQVGCQPPRVEEEAQVDLESRRIVRWSYSYMADCRANRNFAVGQSFEGSLQKS